ncbi:MAG: hypothetical protein WED04_05870 [Promethearchaeati archaeon SRVP18_Atabeyarchaeia-1]
MNIDDVRNAFQKLGIPGRDLYELTKSKKSFPDGCNYRIEISGIERPSTLEALIDESEKRDVPVHRVIGMVMGATLLSEKELEEFAELAAAAKIEVIATPGPRSLWDTGRQIATPEGVLSGMRFRGADQLSYVVYEIKKLIEVGFRGFLVIDEGLLWLLKELKRIGEIPKEVKFKVSVFAGHASPASAKLLESLGADTFNPLADLSLPQLGSLRSACDIPLDIFAILFDSFGGFNRFYDCPEIVRVCSPVYFKIEPGSNIGSTYRPWVSPDALAFQAREKVKFAEIIHGIIEKNYPEGRLSESGASDLAVPKP